jgi:hypothetical protein
MIEFGKAKRWEKITLDDHFRYPIWTSAHDDRHDEEWDKPIISSREVTQEILEHPLIVPIITVRVRDSEHYGTGNYLHSERELFAICLWCDGRWVALEDTGLNGPVSFISVPKILGRENVEFVCADVSEGKAHEA